MDETLFLYGTGRSAETRQQRRTHFPREQQARVGPWIVRPARRVAVRRAQLAKFVDELCDKITRGTVQVQRGDGTVIPLQDVPGLFTDVAPDFDAMGDAELHSLLRGEKPSVAMLRALMKRTSIEERRSIGQGFRAVIEALAETETKEFQKLVTDLDREDTEYREKKYAEQEAAETAEREKRAKEADEQRAREQAERDAAAKVEAEKASTLPAPPEKDDPDDMDFSKKAMDEVRGSEFADKIVADGTVELGTGTSEPVAVADEVKEQLGEVVASMESAAPAETSDAAPTPVEGRELPEGWRALSNQKLQDLITEKGLALPEKKNKAELTKVLENWLAGGS